MAAAARSRGNRGNVGARRGLPDSSLPATVPSYAQFGGGISSSQKGAIRGPAVDGTQGGPYAKTAVVFRGTVRAPRPTGK